jgi:hypothetical protein
VDHIRLKQGLQIATRYVKRAVIEQAMLKIAYLRHAL